MSSWLLDGSGLHLTPWHGVCVRKQRGSSGHCIHAVLASSPQRLLTWDPIHHPFHGGKDFSLAISSTLSHSRPSNFLNWACRWRSGRAESNSHVWAGPIGNWACEGWLRPRFERLQLWHDCVDYWPIRLPQSDVDGAQQNKARLAVSIKCSCPARACRQRPRQRAWLVLLEVVPLGW